MRLFVSAVSLVSTAQGAACSANCDAATLTSNIVNNGPSDFTVVCDEDRTQEGFQEQGLKYNSVYMLKYTKSFSIMIQRNFVVFFKVK